MDTKKLAATFAILMLALGIAGFAYAHWYEYLWLTGEVNTGSLCLEWSLDYDVWPGNLKDLDGDGKVDDPVAIVKHEFVDGNGDGCYEGLKVWVWNAYPSLWINGTLDVTNCGTIPAKLWTSSISIEGEPDGWWEEGIELKTKLVGNPNQIDPEDSLLLNFYIHFTQNAPENAYLTIRIDLTFVEWNAVP
ncbi:MAG: hypothetical protein RMJ03_03460 [Nitrososphaerota archaeon]|nr:hypothetical protein [Nitrososphaerota archaeon]